MRKEERAMQLEGILSDGNTPDGKRLPDHTKEPPSFNEAAGLFTRYIGLLMHAYHPDSAFYPQRFKDFFLEQAEDIRKDICSNGCRKALEAHYGLKGMLYLLDLAPEDAYRHLEQYLKSK
ncbi:hypothetical protein KY363_00980 [Candidatus Woesearchaeota archaeon]|nr:hypothetical protein [Candidatus Woesearchaeota archaeon]